MTFAWRFFFAGVCVAAVLGTVAQAQTSTPSTASSKKQLSAQQKVQVQAELKEPAARRPGALAAPGGAQEIVECFNHGSPMSNRQYFTCTCKNQDCTGFRATCAKFAAYCTELPGQAEGNAACTCDAS